MAPVDKFTFWDHRLGGQRSHIYSSSLKRTVKPRTVLSGASLETTQIILQVKTAAANCQVQTLTWGRFWHQSLGGGERVLSGGQIKEGHMLRDVWTESSAADTLQKRNSLSQKSRVGNHLQPFLRNTQTCVPFYENAKLIFCSPDGKTEPSSLARLDRGVMANIELFL